MIRVEITELNFEQDLYSLVRSFYPGVETRVEIIPRYEEYPLYVKIILGEHAHESEEGDFLTVWLPKADNLIERGTDRLALKSYVKREVYRRLQGYLNTSLPWGTLTGIRPAKLATKLLGEGFSEGEIVRHFKEEYLVSEGKARLCTQVAVNEAAALNDLDYEDGYSIYVGIPFCPTKCLYCSFTSYPIGVWERRVDDYLGALFKEIEYVSKKMAGRKPSSIYIGGGTPTTLTDKQLDRLLSRLFEAFGKEEIREFTVEAGRPDSITREKLEVLRRHGIERISINPQTMQQKTLDLIGRKHTVEQIREVFGWARELGFANINMDLIMGLPGEDIGDVRDTLSEIRKLKPDSLTVHSLAIKRAARLNTMKEAYANYKIENTDEMIELSRQTAEELGLHPYYLYRQKNMAGNFENVGYAAEGKACLYNILIMEEKQTIIALGAGGSTKVLFPDTGEIKRIENVKDVGQYIERIEEMIERKDSVL